jgi:DNA-binding GntR family transcriptional regulator
MDPDSTKGTVPLWLLQCNWEDLKLVEGCPRRMTEYADFDELSEARIQRACGEHIAILDALAEGDVGYAEALLRRHIERAGRDPAQED